MGGQHENDHLRADDLAREDAREVLGRHFSAGRIDYAEYEDRVGAAMVARTFADVRALFTDLPEPHPHCLNEPAAVAASPLPPAAMAWRPPYYAPAYPTAGYQNPLAQLPAPYGVEPRTGRPYSDKQRLVAGLMQIFLGAFGVGRFYTGHTGVAIAQLLITVLTFGFGAAITIVWGLIDGILMLTGGVTDNLGRPLR